MKYIVILSFILFIFLSFLAFSKNSQRRSIGRFILFLVSILSSAITVYCFYMATLPNSSNSGLGNGIFYFLAVIPLLFSFFFWSILYHSYKSEKTYWNKTPEERAKLDAGYREEARSELGKMFKK